MVNKMVGINSTQIRNFIEKLKLNNNIENLVPCLINLDTLHPTQSSLFFSKLNKIDGKVNCSKYSPIIVVQCPNGKYYIQEGHHRAYLAKSQNHKSIYALVYHSKNEKYKNDFSIFDMKLIDDSLNINNKTFNPPSDGLLSLFGDD